MAKASGEQVYQARCASCHDQVGARIPTRESLERLAPSRILRTLDFGAMMSIAYPLKRDEREAVAGFLGKGSEASVTANAVPCAADRPIMGAANARGWTSWSPSASNTRFQSANDAGLAPAQLKNLTLKWAYGFAGDVVAMAAPTVSRGTLFVGSAGGTVTALDTQSGCQYWQYQAVGPVRAAMTVADDAAEPVLVFGDQIGWVYGVEARSGKERWRKRVEDHEATRLTGSLTVHDGVAFVPAASWEETRSIDPAYPCCTFRGSITAVRVGDGSVVWKTYLVDPPVKTGTGSTGSATYGPSGAGVWSAPTVDPARKRLYITTGDNYSHPSSKTSDAIIALDLATGKIAWAQQTLPDDVYNSSCSSGGVNCPSKAGPDYDFGASAMLVNAVGPGSKDVLLAGQKSGVVYAIDPDHAGAVLWQTRVAKGGITGGVQWGLTTDGQFAFAPTSDVVRKQDVLGASLVGNAALEPAEGGGLTALKIGDGSKAWFAAARPCAPPRPGCSPAQPGALTSIPGAVFSGSMDGHVRAFSTADGTVLWDVDTVKPYKTVNGLDATGGSLDGAGPVIAGGMVFVNSGYPRFGGAPGNVLLAFGLK